METLYWTGKVEPVLILINAFQPSAKFQVSTSHLVCTVNQMTGFKSSPLKQEKRKFAKTYF